ncbi:MAG: type II secretion system protein GspM [Nitrospira sp.]|jgi:general secretion pathway protein M|nr:type II secretion system protein GspM [Nitrospira sp.]
MTPQLRERWKQLATRERTLLMIGGAVTAASLLFVLAIDPLLSTLDRLDRQAAKKHKESGELALLAQDYAAKQARLTKAESRMPAADSGFSLLAFMEDAATTAHIRDRIAGMQPQQQTLPQGYQETAVDLRLEGVQLPELLALLREIEQAPYDLHVRHFQVRPKFDNPMNLDATIRVLSFVKG